MENTVKFNARIEPPYEPASVMDLPTPPEDPPVCCAPPPPLKKEVPIPTIPFIYHGDPLVEALPTILVGIGFAWVIGVATGAWIFSSPIE
jgi:hypothetical protein